jgi:hypothetical protein
MSNKPNSINEEAGLGENWVPIDAPPIVPGRNNPAPPPPSGTLFPQTPQYLQGSIPPSFQHDTSFVDTATLTPNAPKFSLMPLGIQANPASNAAIQSTASKSSPPVASGKIELKVPGIFTPIDQIVDLPGPLVLALASELQNTVFAGPASAGSTGGGYVESVDANEVSSYTLSLTNTTVTTDATAFLFTCFQLGTGGSAGATGLTATGGFSYFGGNIFGTYSELTAQTTSSASFSSTLTYTGFSGTNESCAAALVTFGGLVNIIDHLGVFQTITGTANTGFGSYTANISSLAFSSPVTAGSGLVLALYGVGSFANCYLAGTLTVIDTAGNIWYLIASTVDPGWGTVNSTRLLVFYAPNCAAGNPTISITSTHDAWAGYYRLFEVSAASFVTVSATPTFRYLVNADLPVVDVLHGGTGLATLPAHAVLLGEGTAVVGSAAPSTLGYYLKDNGAGVDPSFAALPTSYYQTVEQATVAKTRRPILNFLAPITATDDAGNTSTDIAVPVFIGSGASHAIGLVPDPGASAGTTKFLREDGTWAVAGGAGTAVEINGVGVSSDKQFYFNGVADVVSVWGVQINGAAG